MGLLEAFQKKQKPEKPDDGNSIRTGFILASSPELPSSEAIIKAAADLGEPDLKALPDGNDKVLSFEHSLGSFFVSLMEFRHPDAAKMPEGPFTPTIEEIEATSAHFITALGNGPGSLRKRDLTIARLTGAVALANRSVAAMLGHGMTFHRTAMFISAILEAGDDGVPIPGGIDVTISGEPDGRASILIHGMPRYGRQDLYVTAKATEDSMKFAYEFAASIADWMLNTDEQVPDGDTVGRTAEERITVKRVPNPIDSKTMVIKLDL